MQETRLDEGTLIVEWKLQELFSHLHDKNFSTISPNFLLCGAEYYLKVFPNGHADTDNVGWVSLYLKRVKAFPTKRRISYTMGIRNCDGSVFRSFKRVSEFTENDYLHSKGYGEDRFLETSELEESIEMLSQDGSLTLFCMAQDCTTLPQRINFVKESASQTISQESVDILLGNFKHLLQSRQHSDVTFYVKGRLFAAHKLILVARSRVLSGIFEQYTLEGATGLLTVNDCEPDSFKDFLTFLYTGSLNVVSSSNVFDLYKMAHKYDLGDLKRESVRFMSKTLSVESFFDVAPFAALYQESSLLETASELFISNINAISQHPRWLTFCHENIRLTQLFWDVINRRGMQ